MKQARPDIHKSVAFLTTHVICPDEDDWNKLLRMMRYIRGTKEIPLILSADSINIMNWWVDGSYGIHPDARSQTGGTASLGKVFFVSTSIKQILNTRSSTETELVAADDLMPHLCWTNYFWNAKAIISILRSCIRTISRQLSSRTTEGLPIPRERNI